MNKAGREHPTTFPIMTCVSDGRYLEEDLFFVKGENRYVTISCLFLAFYVERWWTLVVGRNTFVVDSLFYYLPCSPFGEKGYRMRWRSLCFCFVLCLRGFHTAPCLSWSFFQSGNSRKGWKGEGGGARLLAVWRTRQRAKNQRFSFNPFVRNSTCR